MIIGNNIKKMILSFLVFLCLFLISYKALSIVNVEKQRKKLDDSGWAGSIEGNIIGYGGNTNNLSLGSSVFLGWGKSPFSLFVTSQGLLVINEGERIISQGYGHFRYVQRLSPNVSGESFFQIEGDEFRNLRTRYLNGYGLRFDVIPDILYLGGSFMPERTVIAEENEQAVIITPRWSSYLSLLMDFDKFEYEAICYYQPNILNSKDIRVLVNSNLTVGIFKRISTGISFDAIYESIVPSDIDKFDWKISNIFRAEF